MKFNYKNKMDLNNQKGKVIHPQQKQKNVRSERGVRMKISKAVMKKKDVPTALL